MYALFADPHAAEQALARLEALGLGSDAIRTYGRAANGHMGSFADSGAHEHTPARDHVGSFGDSGAHEHTPARDHVGSFADSGAHEHTPARDHVGSFASTDPGPRARARLERELVEAGVPADELADLLGQIEAGAQLVLVRAPADQAEAVSAALAQRG